MIQKISVDLVVNGAINVTSTPSAALHTCMGQQKLKVFPANKSKNFLLRYKCSPKSGLILRLHTKIRLKHVNNGLLRVSRI
ncbi:MAG TPA: hypothetical protein PLW69_09455, partial [Agitococcus sp.]|nr:hypothetical protein [Agitococcus sp.]